MYSALFELYFAPSHAAVSSSLGCSRQVLILQVPIRCIQGGLGGLGSQGTSPTVTHFQGPSYRTGAIAPAYSP
jgi:hypothetical protein